LPHTNLRTRAWKVKADVGAAPCYSGRVAPTASIGEARRRLPRDFLELLGSSFPQPAAERILRGMGARRPVTLRVNTLRSDAAALMRFLKDNAVKHQRVAWYPDAFVITDLRERDVERWPAYAEGGVYLQSLSSMVPALALAPAPGERVLDAAAAPGSKTTQMAALMGNTGVIVANDVDPVRAERLAYNVRVQGCSIVEVRVGRGERLGELLPAQFDRVLLDVPCSGEGRFIVHEPATTRPWSLKAVAECARLQRKLLASGTAALKPGGMLVYSTCTLNLEENERMVHWALSSLPLKTERIPVSVPGSFAGMARGLDPGVGLALRIFPDPLREGFFVCRMRKRV
jgi:NOL1/NOP2/sun family putative RNA methylase